MRRGDLLDNIDTTLSQIGRYIDAYRRQPNVTNAYELRYFALVMAVMADELARRKNHNYN